MGAGLCAAGLLAGCGAGAPNCGGGDLVLQVSPAAATVDHLAAHPGNEAHFSGVATYIAAAGCPVSSIAMLEYAIWTNPDPVHIQISSANDETNGTAVCLGATAGAVTLTGAFAPQSVPPTATTTAKTVLLTCK